MNNRAPFPPGVLPSTCPLEAAAPWPGADPAPASSSRSDPEYDMRPHRVQIVPLADDRLSFRVDGVERLCWNFARRFPRPHLFPVIGPSGRSVTRMGHPGAPDHDHHRSIWFAHQNVGGVNFWEDRGGEQQIRQEQWIHYQDGDDEAMAVFRLGWFDAHAVRLLQQDVMLALRPLPRGESWIEVQSQFSTTLESIELAKTNFGILAVRVSKDLSALFGGGRLRNSDGLIGEPAIFGQPAEWMDYSGPNHPDGLWEGITYFDHPMNPHQPTHWHVRDDGWMTASFSMMQSHTMRKAESLTLRYALHVHVGDVVVDQASDHRLQFAESKPFAVIPGQRPYRVQVVRGPA